DAAFSECAQLGVTRGKACTGVHGGQDKLGEAVGGRRPLEESPSLPEAVDGPMVIAPDQGAYAAIEGRLRVQDDIPTSRGKREGALGGSDGLVIRAHGAEML